MPFSFGCFFSYRHYPNNRIYERFIEGFYSTLKEELELLGVQIFRDEDGMQKGQIFPKKLSKALCESACLVAVYTPGYFSKETPWCAQEFKAMQVLEEARLGGLEDHDEKTYGLIIVVVLRNEESLFEEIKGRRRYFNFERYTLSGRRIQFNSRCATEIRTMADYIYRRLNLLKKMTPDPCAACHEFQLPGEAEVAEWLDRMEAGEGRASIAQRQTPDGPVNAFPLR